MVEYPDVSGQKSLIRVRQIEVLINVFTGIVQW
jgi:hypothetical protein